MSAAMVFETMAKISIGVAAVFFVIGIIWMLI